MLLVFFFFLVVIVLIIFGLWVEGFVMIKLFLFCVIVEKVRKLKFWCKLFLFILFGINLRSGIIFLDGILLNFEFFDLYLEVINLLLVLSNCFSFRMW